MVSREGGEADVKGRPLLLEEGHETGGHVGQVEQGGLVEVVGLVRSLRPRRSAREGAGGRRSIELFDKRA